MEERFYKSGKLDDKRIIEALKRAAVQYENGEIVEVQDTLIGIMNAIYDFEKHTEKTNE